MSAAPATTATGSRWVDPNDLICPGCGEQVECAPPQCCPVHDGLRPVTSFSHPDRSPLCRDRAGRIAEPVEVTR